MRLAAGTQIPAKALVFDMDGTLIDSSLAIARLWRQWASRHSADADLVIRESAGRRAVEVIRLFGPPGLDAGTEASMLTDKALEETEGLVALPGAASLLRALPSSAWAIVTSARSDLARKWLAHTGLPTPDLVIGSESVSTGKPHPEGYLQAIRRLGVEPAETIVFEDAPAGIAAGRATGAKVIALGTMLSEAELDGQPWIVDFSGISYDADAGLLTIGTR